MKVGSSNAKCPSFVCRHGCDALLNMEVRKRIVRVEVAHNGKSKHSTCSSSSSSSSSS